MPQSAANRQLILTTIEAVEVTISHAEAELQEVVEALDVEPRADKALASNAVRDAFGKLAASKSRLAALQKITADDEIERTLAAIVDAERDLDQAIVEIVDAETTLVTDVVKGSFARLREAKEKLRQLEVFIGADME